MNISFVTTAGTDEEGRALLANLGMPFRQLADNSMARAANEFAKLNRPAKFSTRISEPLQGVRSFARGTTATSSCAASASACSALRGEIPGVTKASW